MASLAALFCTAAGAWQFWANDNMVGLVLWFIIGSIVVPILEDRGHK